MMPEMTPEEMAISNAIRFWWWKALEPREEGVRAVLLQENAGTIRSIYAHPEE